VENKEISKILKFTSSLMEIHGENEFKSRGYSIASYKVDQLNKPLNRLSPEEIADLEGIGKSMASKISDMIETKKLAALEELLLKTPEGILEMMDLKGFGPKKIKVVWKELDITDINRLEEACNNDEIAQLKGFGKKTQQTILEAIAYKNANKGLLLLSEAEIIAKELEGILSENFDISISTVGEVRRKCEIIHTIELLIGNDKQDDIIEFLENHDNLFYNQRASGPFIWRGNLKSPYAEINIHFCSPAQFTNQLLIHTAHINHLNYVKDGKQFLQTLKETQFQDEQSAYQFMGLPYIAPELREGMFEYQLAEQEKFPEIIQKKNIKGIIHSHSTYSDGAHTLEEMASKCKALGYEYLGITDHSKTAVYASGLTEDEIKRQHEEIDQLNEKLAPFKIFKGIESDILGDGSLDYKPKVLDSFDFIIGSIHSNLNMKMEQATERIVKAIRNPYTTMIGHLTARVLLRRPGYPVDYKIIIDECVKNDVILEVNAHPSRLDLDWRWLRHALDQGMITSINPDAHRVEGIEDVYYGTMIARKAALAPAQCLNTLSLDEISAYFRERKEKALARA